MKALFWAFAGFFCPLFGLAVGLAVNTFSGDYAFWAVWICLPPVATLFVGYLLGRTVGESVVGAAVSAGPGFVALLLLLLMISTVSIT